MTGLAPSELLCEYAENPIGLDEVAPRFTWILTSSRRGALQTAYQILVARSREALKSDVGDIWDSTKVASNRSVNIPYEGTELHSGERYFWKVRVWDRNGEKCSFSDPASFEMGLLKAAEWRGSWIRTDKEVSAPIFRKVFILDERVDSARIYLSGLGLYELYVNGERVGDHVLDPVLTDYRERVPYVTYDVSDRLNKGENVVAVMLGNGWYRGLARQRFMFDDSVKLLLQLNIDLIDGTTRSVESDTSWRAVAGPITANSFQAGEIYDARLEKPGWDSHGFNDSEWATACDTAPPKGTLFSQMLPAMKVTQTLKPERILTPRPETYVCDFGQLFSGWTAIRFRGERSAKITITYSSRSLPNGAIDETGGIGPCESDTYILKGDPDGETYEPRFTFHPVQYVQITGYRNEISIADIEGRVVHSAIDSFGEFACSNELFNKIHENVTWTLRNALKGFPMDCLHREPLGYNEPASVSSVLFTRTYMPTFWTKWIKDIRDNQREDGSMSDWAPELPGSNRQHDAAQAGNYPALLWYLYEYYDDTRMLELHYKAAKRWVDFLGTIAENGIITTGWLGDHMVPGPSPGYEGYTSEETPPPLIWTGYYYRGAVVVAQAADVLGYTDEVKRYAALAERIKQTFNAEFFDEKSENYVDGAQTANAFPLVLGLVPEEHESGVLKNLVREIMVTHNGHIHTGHVGTASVLEVLVNYEESDALFSLASASTYPGWGYMVAQGATTIWESWGHDWAKDRVGSHKAHRADSMMMWGSIDKFFYHYVAGIGEPAYHGPEKGTPGFREIRIRPHVVGDLTYARARVMTVCGEIASSWRVTENAVFLDVDIPVNATAKIAIPNIGMADIEVLESGVEIYRRGTLREDVPGILGGEEMHEFYELSVGSGSYSFVLKGKLT